MAATGGRARPAGCDDMAATTLHKTDDDDIKADDDDDDIKADDDEGRQKKRKSRKVVVTMSLETVLGITYFGLIVKKPIQKTLLITL